MKKETATQKKARIKKLEPVLKDLQSSEDVVILDALKKVKKLGDASAIPLLVQLLIDNENSEVQAAVKEVLFNLKDTDVVAPLMEIIASKRAKDHRAVLLSIFWEAGLEVKGHLSFLIDIAIESDYLTAFECFTIIEHGENIGSGAEMEREIIKLRDYLEVRKPEHHAVLEQIQLALTHKLVG